MPTEPVETQAVSLAEAGRILNYRDPGTIVRLIQTGQLQGFRARTPSGFGAWRVTCASIANFMAGVPQGHVPRPAPSDTAASPRGQVHAADARNAGDFPPGIKSFITKDLP